MFSLESPHRGDSNEYTQYTIFNIEKITRNFPKSEAMEFFQGTEERVRNNRGKRAIGVRVMEALLYTPNAVNFSNSTYYLSCFNVCRT